jgi:hypothetical protein
LRHRQANQCLNACQKDMAGGLGVFLIKADRTLVYSHSTLLKPRRRFCSYSYRHRKLVYVGLLTRGITILTWNSALRAKRNFVPESQVWFSACVVLNFYNEMT